MSPDFLNVLELLNEERRENYDSTQLICLGSKQDSNYTAGNHYDKVEIVAWQYKHDVLAFDRYFWQRLKNCADLFCDFNDPSWQFSLENVNRKCLNSNVKTMITFHPRVISQKNPEFIEKFRFPKNPDLKTIFEVNQVLKKGKECLTKILNFRMTRYSQMKLRFFMTIKST